MNELIATKENENGQLLVNGRDLHEFLEVKTAYKDWFPRMVRYGFKEGRDFCSFLSESRGGRPAQEHHVTLNMAKEISMLQRNVKGKQARQYFLDLEFKWNSPEMVMKRAMEYANAQVAKLETRNLVLEQQGAEMKPKADYYDVILQNKSLVTVTGIAKDYGMSARKFNEMLHEFRIQYKQAGVWYLYAKCDGRGYTQSVTHAIDEETSRLSMKWTKEGRVFLYEFLKEKGILPMIEREQEKEAM